MGLKPPWNSLHYRPMITKRQESRLFGDSIRNERHRLKLNQSDFAELGGVSKASQVAYEANSTEPSATYLWRLGESGVDAAWVLTGRRATKGIQWELLFEIRNLVEIWAQEQRDPPSREKKDLLLRSLYNQFSANGEIDTAELESTFRMVG